MASSHKDNYDKILPIFYDIDSSVISSEREKLNDVIVKGSLPITRHENSKWVYPSYYLIGKARYYTADFPNAIETFRYINVNAEDDDIRQKALISLMRTYIDYDELNNAVGVADYIRKEKLTKENELEFLLTKAYFFSIRKDYNNMVKNLSQAMEFEPKRKYQARYYFTLGQVYQLNGFEGEAYNNFKKCLKSNPSFELSFHAKLNLAQVTQLDQKVSLKKIRKYFTKLLKDDKNREFVDRIYYEMGNFEMKHQQPEQAVAYYKSSIQSSINNPRQKGLAYLKLGEMYYNYYKNYRLAQSYYDSTISVLPQTEENYQEVKDRAAILTDFVTQLETIQLQDSLLELSEMKKSDVYDLLEKYVKEQEALERAREREAKRIARQNASAGAGFGTGRDFANPFGIDENSPTEGETWYFYNLTAVGSGSSIFQSRWGNRPLEDNWRRSQRTATADFADRPDEVDTQQIEEELVDEEIPDTEKKVNDLFSTIPYSEQAKQEALSKIEVALFKLGGIYNFQLEERQNALETFDELLVRFPGSEYEPETLYLLYLEYKKDDLAKSESYKQQLISKYPRTLFAKLAENPNYEEESDEAAERLQRLYKIAYDYYQQENYNQAKLLVSRALKQYPDNSFSDQLRILGILIDGKVEGQYRYQYELQQFIEQYPESDMLSYAESLLEASKSFKSKELQRKGAQYITYFDQPHFFIFVYPKIGANAELIPALIENYINENYNGGALKIGNLNLNEGFSIVLVTKFDTKEQAIDFYNSFNKNSIKLPMDESASFEHFIISEDNFQIFYQTKKTEDYLEFFNENYLP